MRKHALRYSVVALLAFLWAFIPAKAQADEQKEYLVKAAFLYKFVNFVEWPGDKAIVEPAQVDICVLGNTPMSNMQEIFKKGSKPSRTLSLVKESQWKNAPSHCHILFIGVSEKSKIDEILAGLKGKPILTVSDIPNFAERGGVIEFAMDNNTIKLIINMRSASAAGMRIDAQLLEVALRVVDS